jgi:hypothetical protein
MAEHGSQRDHQYRGRDQHRDHASRPGRPSERSERRRAQGDEPSLPDEIAPEDLDFRARVELKSLSKENADLVARHLAMVSILADDDPELAHRHAMAAAAHAGRLGIVRETSGLTAYRLGDYALALRELRTYRRITGSDEHAAIMADCERGLGRSQQALEFGESVDRSTLTKPARVELAIVMSGARRDLDDLPGARRELEIPELEKDRAFSYSARLFEAYADVLHDLDDPEADAWQRRSRRAAQAWAKHLGGDSAKNNGDGDTVVDLGALIEDAGENQSRENHSPSRRPARDDRHGHSERGGRGGYAGRDGHGHGDRSQHRSHDEHHGHGHDEHRGSGGHGRDEHRGNGGHGRGGRGDRRGHGRGGSSPRGGKNPSR